MSSGVIFLPDLEQDIYNLPFDQFGRYHMIRETLDACRSELGVGRLSILDVGGFFNDNGTPTLPITRFLPDDEITVVDVVDCDLPGYIKGDGMALDFVDDAFDFVVSADTLEHIPPSGRADFWHELLRTARHGVVLLAPFGSKEVELGEALLSEYIRNELGSEQRQLKEHREYGLPNLAEWLEFLQHEGYIVHSYPTGYLSAWLGMMLLKHMLMRMAPGVEAQHLIDSYYNHYYFPTERRTPTYRQMIIASQTASLLEAADGVLAQTIMQHRDDSSADWGSGLLPTLVTIVQRQLGTQIEQQRGQVEAFHKLIEEQSNLLQVERNERSRSDSEQLLHYRQQVSMLERLLADQQITIQHMQEELRLRAEQAEKQLGFCYQQTRQQAERYDAALRDLTERSGWLESQAAALRSQLRAVQNGRVMRILNRLSRSK